VTGTGTFAGSLAVVAFVLVPVLLRSHICT
jgi:hypothetical protein